MKHRFNPFCKCFLCLGYCLAINSGCRPIGYLTQILPNPLMRDMMSQGRKLQFWLTTSFCCYSFESRCHDWRIFSLHRRPYPPFEWGPCFPQTIRFLPAASQCSRLSRPRSTISRSDFRQVFEPSLLYRLVGPYPAATGNLADLPCSHKILCLHAGGTNPGSITGCSPWRKLCGCLFAVRWVIISSTAFS